ncbi:hypothetical protein D6851_11945 [Altericroceibacterium spongiae]|uniref:DUF1579 domain-containing protein n=1 Tax=Altericroceibacterium spongiae TaxID=2320269 RepID=A0A420EER7_9SPHN|nr:hypothetical protein [Altericroceibacterium spongiae]RKF19185.1 hypothetical protein D6851_11945 [Altericroceibacterium spongiae]
MFRTAGCAMAALFTLSSATQAAEPGTAPLPQALLATVGCWSGDGEVMGKPVTIDIAAKPIVQDAMLALDARSTATADPDDKYAAHLIFGAAARQPGAPTERITGFWADSFGGAFTATGDGESHPDSFDMTYRYADNAFVNHWHISKNRLTWQIVAQDGEGAEKPFASYSLDRTPCDPT